MATGFAGLGASFGAGLISVTSSSSARKFNRLEAGCRNGNADDSTGFSGTLCSVVDSSPKAPTEGLSRRGGSGGGANAIPPGGVEGNC